MLQLPPREVPFWLLVPPGEPARLPSSHEHSWLITGVFVEDDSLWSAAEDASMLSDHGVASYALWRPNDLLERWLPRLSALLGHTGAALDVGCGSGRDAVFMAMQGWSVVGLDNMPKALARARGLAERHAVSQAVDLREVDLRKEQHTKLRRANGARFDLVHVCRFIHRSVFTDAQRGFDGRTAPHAHPFIQNLTPCCLHVIAHRPLMPDLLESADYLIYAHFLAEDEGNPAPDGGAMATEGGGGGGEGGRREKALGRRAQRWADEVKPLRRGEMAAMLKAAGGWEILEADETSPASAGDPRPFSRVVAVKKKSTSSKESRN